MEYVGLFAHIGAENRLWMFLIQESKTSTRKELIIKWIMPRFNTKLGEYVYTILLDKPLKKGKRGKKWKQKKKVLESLDGEDGEKYTPKTKVEFKSYP